MIRFNQGNIYLDGDSAVYFGTETIDATSISGLEAFVWDLFSTISGLGDLFTNISGFGDFFTSWSGFGDVFNTISGLETTLSGYSTIDHLHDDRYYTESEVDTISGALNAKIPTDFYTKAQVDTISGALNAKIGGGATVDYATFSYDVETNNGYTLTGGADVWQTMLINTTVTSGTNITRSTNTITVPAGTYHIRVETPAVDVTSYFYSRLYNNTNAAVLLEGTTYMQDSSTSTRGNFIDGFFITTGSTDILIQGYGDDDFYVRPVVKFNTTQYRSMLVNIQKIA